MRIILLIISILSYSFFLEAGETRTLLVNSTLTSRPGIYKIPSEYKITWPKKGETVKLVKDFYFKKGEVIYPEMNKPGFTVQDSGLYHWVSFNGKEGYLPEKNVKGESVLNEQLERISAPAPAQVKREQHKSTERINSSCNCKTRHATSVCDLQQVTKAVKSGSGKLKSQEDLDFYLMLNRYGVTSAHRCVNPNSPTLKPYNDTYKRQVALAAKNFDVPKEFLTCLIFQESQFRRLASNGAKNPANQAKGHGQIKRDTWKTIANLLSSRKDGAAIAKMEKSLSSDKALLSSYTKKCATNKSLSVCKKIKQLKRNIAFIPTQIRNYEMTIRWRNYVSDLRRESGGKKHRFPSNYNDNVFNSSVNIGATAVYISYMMKRLNAKLKNNKVGAMTGADRIKQMLLVAAAYNAGEGKVAAIESKLIAKKDSQGVSLDEMVAAVKKVKKSGETDRYMNSIQNCLEADNFKPKDSGESSGTKRGQMTRVNKCLRQRGAK